MWNTIRKIVSFFRTETPVIGMLSRLILSDSRQTQDYVNAVRKEKNGEEAVIHFGGKSYRLVRAAAYHPKK